MSQTSKAQQLLQRAGIKFSALDVHQQEFDKGRMFSRRYDADQVDNFLDEVVKDYERFRNLADDLLVEIEALREAASHRGEISVESLHVRLKKVEHHLKLDR